MQYPEKRGINLIFLPADKHESFLQADSMELWNCIARHAQSTQNNKFTISLQCLKENMKDEIDFVPADKHQRFLQIDTIILGLCVAANYAQTYTYA